MKSRWWSAWRLTPFLCLGLAPVGCGQTEAAPGPASAGDSGEGAGPHVSEPTGGPAPAGGSALAGGSSGSAGQPEPVSPEPASVDISGRWAMFHFEDPVGVQLIQKGPMLSGQGCASGTPPVEALTNFCGGIWGGVQGNAAHFAFSFGLGGELEYGAEVVVSKDAQRMTGTFRTTPDASGRPTAWVRLPAAEAHLPGASETRWLMPEDPLNGVYVLRVVEMSGDATEYDPAREYGLGLSWFRGVDGDLGSFWHTEFTWAEPRSSLVVGPVPATAPELAVSMTLEIESDELTRLRATTGSGHDYVFQVEREAQ